MDNKRIEKILASFYAGNTSVEEEQLLTDFFRSEQGQTVGWENERKLFIALSEMAADSLPQGVSERLEQYVDVLSTQEKAGKRLKLRSLWGGSVAAALLALVGLFVFNAEQQGMPSDTFDDPIEASRVASEALTMISTNLNKGLVQVEYTQQEMQNANNKINKLVNQPK